MKVDALEITEKMVVPRYSTCEITARPIMGFYCRDELVKYVYNYVVWLAK